MDATATKSPVMLYTEQTPNPEALKYVTNRMLYSGIADFKELDLASQWSPMAKSLMELPYVKSAYFNNNYVTVTKEMNYEWEDIMLKLKEFIKDYIEKEGEVVKEGFAEFMKQVMAENNAAQFSGENGEIAKK
ncbi:MAG: NifU N-terminal domain-containing protein [Saprospiraceae bacterium]